MEIKTEEFYQCEICGKKTNQLILDREKHKWACKDCDKSN